MSECPTCGGPAVRTCRCRRGDSRCAQGHEWHSCPVHKAAHPWPSQHAGGRDCVPGQEARPPSASFARSAGGLEGCQGEARFTFDLEAR
jgi:hypothetical protein